LLCKGTLRLSLHRVRPLVIQGQSRFNNKKQKKGTGAGPKRGPRPFGRARGLVGVRIRALRAGLRRAAPEDGGGLAAPRGRREVACAAPHGRKEGSAPRRARGEQQAARRRFGGTRAEGEEPLPRREGEGRCFL